MEKTEQEEPPSENGKSLVEKNEVKQPIRKYEGPKLFGKPITKYNLVTIQNAIHKALEGPTNAKVLKKVQDTINTHSQDCDHFLILFRNRFQFRGLYQYSEKQNTITKLDGSGPKSIENEDILRYFKYDSTKRQFTEVQTKHISPTIVAFSLELY